MKPILELETQFSALGKIRPSAPHPGEFVYNSRAVLGDYRKAEANAFSLNQRSQEDLLQIARTQISRGHLALAKSQLENIFSQMSSESFAEWKLEMARIFTLEGKWQEATVLCTEALSTNPPGVTRQTLHQVRAFCHYELGQFDLSLRDIDFVVSLRKLYPFGNPVFYAEALRSKISIRKNWSDHWESFVRDYRKDSSINADFLLTDWRLRFEQTWYAKNFEFKTLLALAFGCLLISRAMGDSLYEELAAWDLKKLGLDTYFSQWPNHSDRVKHWMNDSQSTTGKWFSEANHAFTHSLPLQFSVESRESRESSLEVDYLLDSHREISVNLSDLKVISLQLKPQTKKFLQLFQSNTKLTKEALFKSLWKLPKFVSERHDSLIRTLLTRVKKETGVAFKSSGEQIEIVRGWVL